MSIEKRSILKYIKCVEFESDSFYGIKEIKDLIEELETEGCTDITLSANSKYGDIGIEGYIKRLETDEEFEKRATKLKEEKDKAEKAEYSHYLKLKKEYEETRN